MDLVDAFELSSESVSAGGNIETYPCLVSTSSAWIVYIRNAPRFVLFMHIVHIKKKFEPGLQPLISTNVVTTSFTNRPAVFPTVPFLHLRAVIHHGAFPPKYILHH